MQIIFLILYHLIYLIFKQISFSILFLSEKNFSLISLISLRVKFSIFIFIVLIKFYLSSLNTIFSSLPFILSFVLLTVFSNEKVI